jgi:hypothetical protein
MKPIGMTKEREWVDHWDQGRGAGFCIIADICEENARDDERGKITRWSLIDCQNPVTTEWLLVEVDERQINS